MPRFNDKIWFPDDWIMPGEFSYCGTCGVNESLRPGKYQDRPLCIFCRSRNEGVKYIFATLTLWERVKIFLSRLQSGNYKYLFCHYYGKATKVESELDREISAQKKIAIEANIARDILANERKNSGVPPLFWVIRSRPSDEGGALIHETFEAWKQSQNCEQ